MKRRKSLLLIPVLGLFLTGCSFSDVTSWVNNNMFSPVKNFFSGLFGKKDNQEQPSEDVDPTPGPDDPTPGPVDPTPGPGIETIGSKENPVSVSAFMTKVDELIDFNTVDEGSSKTDKEHWFYVEGKVRASSAANNYGEIEFLNIDDTQNGSLEITGRFAIVDSALGDFSAKDSLAGYTVVVEGCGSLFNHSTKGKQYQLAKLDNDHKVKVVKATAPTPSGLDYGTAEAPLTVTQAKALIDAENPTLKRAYVTGKVKSNEAYSTQYTNIMRITITDDTNDLVIFKCGKFSSEVDITGVTANSLKGYTVVATGKGELYQGTTYELTDEPEIIKFSGEPTPQETIDNYGSVTAPLTIAEAKHVIDVEGESKQPVYVTGEVTSNTAWSTQYKNIDITLTDGTNEFKLYRASKLPDNAQPAANALVGKVVVAHGTAILHASSNTYELAQGCEVDKIEDAAPIEVTGVALSESSIGIEVGGHASLSASVLPANASQEVEWKVTQGETPVISFANGVVTGLAVGTATITATSVADPTKSASCTVTVSAATKVLSEISVDITNAKKNYVVSEKYSEEGLKVTAHYTSGDDADVTGFVSWTFDPVSASKDDTAVSVTASYTEGEVTKTKTVSVPVEVADVNKLQEAYEAAEKLPDKTSSTVKYEFSGVVVGTRGTNDYFIQNGSYGIDLYQPGSVDNLEYGRKVTVNSVVKKYNGTLETGDNPEVTVGEVASSMPNPVVIDSAEKFASLKQNILVSITGVVKNHIDATGNAELKLDVNGDEIVVYLKSSIRSAAGLLTLNNAYPGDTVTIENAVSGIYNTTLQVLPCAESVATLTPKAVASATVTGPSEEVPLNSPISLSSLSAKVVYVGESDEVDGYIEDFVSVPVTSSGGQYTGYVIVHGYSGQVPFTYTVANEEAQTEDVTIVPSDGAPVTTTGAWSITKGGVTLSATQSQLSSDTMKVYKNQTFTISSQKLIYKIVFTTGNYGSSGTAAGYGAGGFNEIDGYSVSQDQITGTWEGSSNSIVLTASGHQVRITSITITIAK